MIIQMAMTSDRMQVQAIVDELALFELDTDTEDENGTSEYDDDDDDGNSVYIEVCVMECSRSSYFKSFLIDYFFKTFFFILMLISSFVIK